MQTKKQRKRKNVKDGVKGDDKVKGGIEKNML